jgi:2-polyprenyl-3-methyl-5-hydroxy-6-metoxy-1,4-benzoquinol methylase
MPDRFAIMQRPANPVFLTHDEVVTYWDGRHREHGGLRSGGHIGYDEPTNENFYAVRLGQLLEQIGPATSQSEPLDVLEAGCGLGYFARGVARCGHRVDAIDSSEHAIMTCRTAGGGPRYAVSTLAGWTSPYPYDVVYAVDVLFHVTDDEEWRASVRNLASLVRLGGRLLLTDWNVTEERVFSNYQLARTVDAYVALTAATGLSYLGFRPYGFRGSPVGFHLFYRTG